MSIFGKIKDAIFPKARAATPPAGSGAPGGGISPQPQQTAPVAVSEVGRGRAKPTESVR